MTMPTTVPEALNAAADLLAETGWCKDLRRNAFGQHCMIGAVAQVTTGDPYDSNQLYYDTVVALQDSLGHAIGLTHTYVTGWNDERGRTPIEAIEALRQAAEEHS